MSSPPNTISLDALVELRLEKVASYKDPALPYVGLEHIASGRPTLLGTLPSSASVSINSVFARDDILFGKLRPNLRKSLRAPFPGYCSTDILVLRARAGIRPDFAGHLFQWEPIFASAAASAAGTKMPRTSWGELKRYLVRSPESEFEQTRIAAVLDQADEAIAKTEAVIAKLRQVRTGLIHDLLTYGLDEKGHLRDPIAHPEQFQETTLGFVPVGWTVEPLGTALAMRAGAGLTGERITETGRYAVYGGNGIRGYTSTFTHEGRYVLIGRQGALCGNIAIAVGQFYATEHAIVCAPVRPTNPGWLACYLERMNLNRFSEASAQPGLSVQKLAYKEIAVPPFDEQCSIEIRINEFDQLTTAGEQELAKLRQLKSGLMDDLLTGRVRVPEIR